MVARMNVAPVIGDIEFDPNLSKESSALYDVRLIFGASPSTYHAIVAISNGEVVEVDVIEVVP